MKKKIIGFTCSCFDLLHAGHILMLQDAKKQCEYLIVGLQTDPTIDRKNIKDKYSKVSGKAKNRPIQTLKERLIMINSIKFVDEVFIYDTEQDLYNWLDNNKWDIRILGSDWKNKKYTGYDIKGKVYFHNRNHNFSTTELRKKIINVE